MAASKTQVSVVGLNITMEEEEGILVFRVDPSVTLGPSKSGKATLVATSQGNKLVTPDGLVIGINAYRALPQG